MKRPAFQFYPADWRKDPGLSTCSLAARGLWIELMCLAHEADVYGELSIGGNPITGPQIARAVGEIPSVVAKLLAELEAATVFSRTEAGAIYSRRMVEDEHIRNVRAKSGRLGGNPNLVGALVKQTDKQIPTPSSSSSSSLKKRTPKPPEGASAVGRFPDFWQAWPASDRKGGKAECLRVWLAKGLDAEAEAILRHVVRMAETDGWAKDGGAFVPAPVVYLRGRRWDGADLAEAGEHSEDRFAGAI